jgi:hypothetical protein
MLPEALGIHVTGGDTDDRKLFRQQFGRDQIAQGWNQFAFGQVAARPENDHDARVSFPGRRVTCFFGRRINHGADKKRQPGDSVNADKLIFCLA